MVGRRRDRFLIRVSAERAVEIAGDPRRFPEFNPLVRVPETSGRVDEIGNVYHQVFILGPHPRLDPLGDDPCRSTDLADRPRPAPPWATAEVGRLPVFGEWRSTTRYDAVKAGTLVTHDLEYAVPGLVGRVLDLILMRPLLAVAFGLLGRRMRRWIEAAAE
jgi:hypothetical protein